MEDSPYTRFQRVKAVAYTGPDIDWRGHFSNPEQHDVFWKQIATATKPEPDTTTNAQKQSSFIRPKKSDKSDHPSKPPKDPCVCYCHNVPEGPVYPRSLSARGRQGLHVKSKQPRQSPSPHLAHAPPPPPPIPSLPTPQQPSYPQAPPQASPGPGYSGAFDHAACETSSQGSSVAPVSPGKGPGTSPGSVDRFDEQGRPIPKRNKTKVTINRWTTPETERLKKIIGPLSPHDKVSLDRCREIAAELGFGRSHTQVLSRIQTLQRQSLRQFIRSQMLKTESLVINVPACKSGYDGPKDPRRRRSGGGLEGGPSGGRPEGRSGSGMSGVSPRANSSTAGSILDMDQTSNLSYQSESVLTGRSHGQSYDGMPQ